MREYKHSIKQVGKKCLCVLAVCAARREVYEDAERCTRIIYTPTTPSRKVQY